MNGINNFFVYGGLNEAVEVMHLTKQNELLLGSGCVRISPAGCFLVSICQNTAGMHKTPKRLNYRQILYSWVRRISLAVLKLECCLT